MSHIHAFAYKDLPDGIDADDVWEHLIDIDLRPKLIKRIQSIERLDGLKSGSPLRVGSKYYEQAGDTTAPGRSYKAEVTVTEISGGGSVHGGMKSASACTADLDNDNSNHDNDYDDDNGDGDGGDYDDDSKPNAATKSAEQLPYPRTLAISMMEVNSHRRATATFTVEALPKNNCRLLSTLAIVPNGLFGRIMFLFLSCCINRSMTADLLVDLDDIADYFSEKQRSKETNVGSGGDEVESEKQ